MNRKLKAKIVEVFGTQADFSTIVDDDETIISRVVCGRRVLPDKKKKVWAEALDSTVEELFAD